MSVEERSVVEERTADSVVESEISEVFVEVEDVASKEETVEEIGVSVARITMSRVRQAHSRNFYSHEVELEADKREVKVEEADSEVNERPEVKDVVVAESVADVETTESVEDMVDSADADTGSADDIAVSVEDSDDEAVVVPASVIVTPVYVGVVDASLTATSMVDPVSPSTRSVWELPITVCTETVAPVPSMIWTTETVWTTSVMVESLISSSAISSRRLWNSAWERAWLL